MKPAVNGDLLREVEQFLFKEAQLLDSLKFEEWADLFTSDGVYQVPPTDLPHADARSALFLINDDRFRITERAKRLKKTEAHAEYPASRTCRIVSNVTAAPLDDSRIEAASNFVVYRSRSGRLDMYPGRSVYVLERHSELRIQSKIATLSLEALRPQGKVSIII